MQEAELRERTFVIADGRITIPKRIRDRLGLKDGSIVEVYLVGNKIVVEVLVP